MKKKLFAPLLILLLLPSVKTVKAQTTDTGTWYQFKLEKNIKDWKISFKEQVRTMEGVSTLQGLYSTIRVDYKLMKHLKLGTSYQFIVFNDFEFDDYQPRHRLNWFATGNVKLGDFKFSLRERFQMTFKDESVRDYKMNPKNRWRNRLEVEYNIPKCKLTPSFSVETYYQLNNPDGNKFDKIRYRLSADYKINKRNSISLYGIVDNEINVNDPVDRSIIGISYNLKLKKKKD